MFLVGAQPSLVLSAGNGVDTEYGFGLRTNVLMMLGSFFFHFDPMLYRMNNQWGYHLRLGATLRITPAMGVNLSYEYRDITDLGDLDISQASLQGVFAYLTFRYN